MPNWTKQSNAADVLSLGPRTAGQLLRVGIRSVAQLLAAQPLDIEQRLQDERITAQTITNWQHEARLTLAAPQLSADAVQILAAVGFSDLKKIARSTPTELLTAIEIQSQEKNSTYSHKNFSLPSVAVLNSWIRLARKSQDENAA